MKIPIPVATLLALALIGIGTNPMLSIVVFLGIVGGIAGILAAFAIVHWLGLNDNEDNR